MYKISYFLIIILFTSCSVKDEQEYQDIKLGYKPIYEDFSYEKYDSKKYSKYLEENNAIKISMTSNSKIQSLETPTALSGSFDYSLIDVISDFKPTINYITSNKNKYHKHFHVSTSLIKEDYLSSKGSDNDLSLNFGSASGESDLNNRYENEEKTSILSIDIFVFSNDELYTKRNLSINIEYVNKGYQIGFFIGNSGLGKSVYANRRDSINKSLKRLLHYGFLDIVKEIVERENLISKKNNKDNKNKKRADIYNSFYDLPLREDEEQFLENLNKRYIK